MLHLIASLSNSTPSPLIGLASGSGRCAGSCVLIFPPQLQPTRYRSTARTNSSQTACAGTVAGQLYDSGYAGGPGPSHWQTTFPEQVRFVMSPPAGGSGFQSLTAPPPAMESLDKVECAMQFEAPNHSDHNAESNTDSATYTPLGLDDENLFEEAVCLSVPIEKTPPLAKRPPRPRAVIKLDTALEPIPAEAHIGPGQMNPSTVVKLSYSSDHEHIYTTVGSSATDPSDPEGDRDVDYVPGPALVSARTSDRGATASSLMIEVEVGSAQERRLLARALSAHAVGDHGDEEDAEGQHLLLRCGATASGPRERAAAEWLGVYTAETEALLTSELEIEAGTEEFEFEVDLEVDDEDGATTSA